MMDAEDIREFLHIPKTGAALKAQEARRKFYAERKGRQPRQLRVQTPTKGKRGRKPGQRGRCLRCGEVGHYSKTCEQ